MPDTKFMRYNAAAKGRGGDCRNTNPYNVRIVGTVRGGLAGFLAGVACGSFVKVTQIIWRDGPVH